MSKLDELFEMYASCKYASFSPPFLLIGTLLIQRNLSRGFSGLVHFEFVTCKQRN